MILHLMIHVRNDFAFDDTYIRNDFTFDDTYKKLFHIWWYI